MSDQVTCAECQRTVARESTIQYGETVVCGECKPTFIQRLREGASLPGTMDYAGFWIRCGASLIDGILILGVTYPILLAVYGSTYFSDPSFVAGPIDLFLSWVFPAFATVAFWVWKQATPGKMLFRLKIIDAHTSASPGIKQFIIRYVMYFVSALPVGAGFMAVAFDDRKQGWHDKAASTLVIRTRKGPGKPVADG